jgi:uncharacterized linocin/CFP29 family protein
MESHAAVVPWTEEQWDRVIRTVTEEAQRARLAAQFLPIAGPEDPTTRTIAPYTLTTQENPDASRPPPQRMEVNSDPFLPLTTIEAQVQLRNHEIADPELGAALTMFRRAANHIARVEDAVVFNGRFGGNDRFPTIGVGNVAREVVNVTGADPPGGGPVQGIMPVNPAQQHRHEYLTAADAGTAPTRSWTQIPAQSGVVQEVDLVSAIMKAIAKLDAEGHSTPYACVLSHLLFEVAVTPTNSMVMPRDRVLPFLGGPLHRSSVIPHRWGVVVAINPAVVELVVACDINVTYLLTTPEPRYVFRVSEKVALRVKDPSGIALLHA